MYVFKNILTTAKNKETSFKKSVHEKEVSNFNFLTGNLQNTNTFWVHRSDIGQRSLWSDWKRALKRGNSGQEVPIPPQSYKTSESVLFREHDGEERERTQGAARWGIYLPLRRDGSGDPMNGGKEGKIDLTLKGGGGKREGGGRTQRKREREQDLALQTHLEQSRRTG